MKKNTSKISWLGSVLVGATLLAATVQTRAQTVTTSITNNFDAANSSSGWTYWYDLYAPPYNAVIMDWSSTVNNGGGTGSGSLVYSNNWPGTAVGVNGHGQNQNWGTFAHTGGNQYDFSQSIDLTKYDTISFDVRANPNAPLNSDGNLVRMTVGFFCGFTSGTGGVHGETDINIPASATNGWYHAVALVDKTDIADLAVGWALNVNCYGGANNPNSVLFTNTTPTTLWIDNIQANVALVESPPPRLSTEITSASPGLNLLSASGGDQFQRTNIKRTDQTALGFIGQSNVTYSFTITEFPNPDLYPGYQAHIFLATGPGTASSLDYNETNLIWLNIQGNAGGSATAYFRYKINEGGANSNLFGAEYTVGPLGTAWAGQLTNLSAATPIGTWSMTYNQNTNVTLSGPGGVTTSFTLRPEVAAAFTEPLNLVFGAQPNANANRGQKVVLSNAGATNSGAGTSIIYDNFLADSTLDTAKWTVLAGSPNTVYVFPNDPGQKLVKWNLPDVGFYLQVSTNLGSPWNSLVGNLTFPAGGFRNAVVPSSALSSKQNFFRLIKRAFTKLQVLLPGETAAPGTLTGKTGTPTPQNVRVAFEVIVNAVDAAWFPITTVPDQQISLSSSDPAFSWPGFPGTMVNGKIIFDAETWQLSFGTSGSQTITATDLTDNTKTNGISSSVTVNP